MATCCPKIHDEAGAPYPLCYRPRYVLYVVTIDLFFCIENLLLEEYWLQININLIVIPTTFGLKLFNSWTATLCNLLLLNVHEVNSSINRTVPRVEP